MKKEVPIFWGCTFTHNYPFLIKSTKMMLERLGIGVVEVENFGCCPDPIDVKTYGKDVQLALSVRNLTLAERSLADRGKNNNEKMGLKDTFSILRELAIKDGQTRRVVDDKIKMLKETGYAMPKRVGVRKRMGIGPAPEIAREGLEDIKHILEGGLKK